MSKEPVRLLKAEAARGLGAKVAFNFDDLRRQCDEYVDRARQQALQLLADARAEAELIRDEARAEGANQGRREGLQRAAEEIEQQAQALVERRLQERLRTALPAVQAAADALTQERDRWLARWEATAVELCVAIAEKLVHRQLEQRPEIATPMIAETLRLAAGSAKLRVHLHPEDAAQLGEQAEELVRQLSTCAAAQIVPSSNVPRGGCLVETDHGSIDGRVATQLERIRDELLHDV